MDELVDPDNSIVITPYDTPRESEIPALGVSRSIREAFAEDDKVPSFPNEAWIELTLNYPRTQRFLNMTTFKQKQLYRRLYDEIIHVYGLPRLKWHEYTFEQCANGHIHLHALICYKMRDEYYIGGLVRDVTITYLNCLVKRYRSYRDANYHCDWHRYRCPSVVCQYRSPDEVVRLEEWRKYMKKNSHIDI